MRRAILNDLDLYATIEELIAQGHFDDAITQRARDLGWKPPITNRELEAMAKAYATGEI